MKVKTHIVFLYIFFSLFLLLSCNSFSQTIKESPKRDMKSLIYKMADSLVYYYVDINEGKAIGDILKDKFHQGNYAKIKDPKLLAEQLTSDLRSFNNDKHLYVSYNLSAQNNSSSKIRSKNYYGKGTNFGFQKIQFYENNIGYIKIDHFSNWDYANQARQKATEVMQLLGNSNFLIIDVRNNSGGVPYLASYLVSYLFNEDVVHLADFYSRFNDSSYGIYTEPLIPGQKFPDLPVFVLVNNKSASASEELAFWLQNHQRATIIGEPTAGAGFGAMTHKLSDEFSISISSEKEIDPITKKGFQKTGVIPDIILESEMVLEETLILAKKIILENQNRLKDNQDKRLLELNIFLEDKTNFVSQEEIYNRVLALHKDEKLDYNDIKMMGYKYIKEPKKSIPIFKVNTILYSFYPHPFDSYAEALMKDEKFEEALINYDKAITLAKLKNNGGLTKFQENKEKCKKLYDEHLLKK